MNRRGYTLLEVTLFMAISAGLAVVAFVGLGPRLRNIRFTDSVRSLESNIAKNFSERVNGVNNRTSPASCTLNGSNDIVLNNGTNEAGSTENCVNNGLVAIFRYSGANQVVYRTIVSLRKPRAGCVDPGTPIEMLLQCHSATMVNSPLAPDASYSYVHGLTQSSNHTGFAYLIDPNSGATYRLQITDTLSGGYSGRMSASNFTRVTAVTSSFPLCFNLGSRQARFTFSNQSLTPRVQFNQGCS